MDVSTWDQIEEKTTRVVECPSGLVYRVRALEPYEQIEVSGGVPDLERVAQGDDGDGPEPEPPSRDAQADRLARAVFLALVEPRPDSIEQVKRIPIRDRLRLAEVVAELTTAAAGGAVDPSPLSETETSAPTSTD